MFLVGIPVREYSRDSTASDKISRNRRHARQISLFPVRRRNQTGEVSHVRSSRTDGVRTLTDCGHNWDPFGQKYFLHSLCHPPVEVIDGLRSTGIFPVIVVPVCWQCGRNTMVDHGGVRTPKRSAVSVSIARSFDLSDIGMNVP